MPICCYAFSMTSESEPLAPTPHARAAAAALKTAETPPIMDTQSQELLSLAQDPYVDLDRVVIMIEAQPALCARLLGIANSALYAPDPPIVSVSGAVIRVLGLDLTRGIILGFILRQTVSSDACAGFDAKRFWRDSLKLARLARECATLVPAADEETPTLSYVGGLLHRVGLLVTAAIAPSELDAAFAGAPDVQLRERMSVRLGYDHLQASLAVAELWELPDQIANSLREGQPTARPGYFVTIAKQLVDADNVDGQSVWQERCIEVAELLNTDVETLNDRYQFAQRESELLSSVI